MFHFNLFSSILYLVLHVAIMCTGALSIVCPYCQNYVHFTRKLAFFSYFFLTSFENSCSVAFVLFIVLIGVSIVTLIIIIIITRTYIEHGHGVCVGFMSVWCAWMVWPCSRVCMERNTIEQNVEFHFTRFSIECVYRLVVKLHVLYIGLAILGIINGEATSNQHYKIH